MDAAEEHRARIKFCVRNGKTGAETLQMLRTAFSDDCLSQAVVYPWVKRFKEGRESLKDDPYIFIMLLTDLYKSISVSVQGLAL
jgi:transposase